MALSERQIKILRLLAATDDWMDNREIPSLVGGSGRETVRKDLTALEEQGYLERVHGKTRARKEAIDREVLKSLGLLTRDERQEELLAVLEKNRSVRIATLAGVFHVSEATIRGDLAELVQEDRVSLRYGKAHYLASTRNALLDMLPSDFSFPESIQYMADRASQFITFGDRIFIDSSPGSLCILTRVDTTLEIDIFTESIRISLLAARRGMRARVHLLGGAVNPATLTTQERCQGIETVNKAFSGLIALDDGSLVHRSAASARILESILPPDCIHYMHIEVSKDVFRNGSRDAAELQPHGPALGIGSGRIGEIIAPDNPAVLVACDRAGIPAAIARESHVVLNPLGRSRRIGVAMLDASHEFSQQFLENMQKKIRGLSDYRFVIADNRMDDDTTLANLDLFVKEGCDLIIEYQHEHRLGRLIAERMCRAKTPILAIDIAIPGAYYFGANNYEAGRIAGEKLAEIMKTRYPTSRPSLVVVADRGSGDASQNRVAGTIDAFKESSRIPERRIVILDSRNDSLSAEKVLLEHFAGAHAGPWAIACVNANLAIGAVRAFQKSGMKDVVIAAHNDTQQIKRELEDPESALAGVVAYHPETYGQRILSLAERLLGGQPVAPATYVEHTWIPAGEP